LEEKIQKTLTWIEKTKINTVRNNPRFQKNVENEAVFHFSTQFFFIALLFDAYKKILNKIFLTILKKNNELSIIHCFLFQLSLTIIVKNNYICVELNNFIKLGDGKMKKKLFCLAGLGLLCIGSINVMAEQLTSSTEQADISNTSESSSINVSEKTPESTESSTTSASKDYSKYFPAKPSEDDLNGDKVVAGEIPFKDGTSSRLRSGSAINQTILYNLSRGAFRLPTIENNWRDYEIFDYETANKKPLGIVVHETANPNDSIAGEIAYMDSHWENAFVHAFADQNTVKEIHNPIYGAWGAGRIANKYYIHIELVEVTNITDFEKSILNDAYYCAVKLKQFGLTPSRPSGNIGDTSGSIWSHSEISSYLGGTDHTDPIGYFNKYGYSMNEFYQLVQHEYQQLDVSVPSAVYTGDRNGDNVDSIMIRQNNEYYIKNSFQNSAADQIVGYGKATDTVLVGDWDGDGKDTLAVRRGNVYYVKNSMSGGEADQVVGYGKPDDTVLVGDWNGDGIDTFAVRRGNVYYVKNSMSSGEADQTIGYGKPDDTVLVGDWNGDGKDTLAVRRDNLYYVKNSIAGGVADQTVGYGKPTDDVLVGDWNGDNIDTFTVQRENTFYVKNSISGGEAEQVATLNLNTIMSK
jgi:hypothetical protein